MPQLLQRQAMQSPGPDMYHVCNGTKHAAVELDAQVTKHPISTTLSPAPNAPARRLSSYLHHSQRTIHELLHTWGCARAGTVTGSNRLIPAV